MMLQMTMADGTKLTLHACSHLVTTEDDEKEPRILYLMMMMSSVRAYTEHGGVHGDVQSLSSYAGRDCDCDCDTLHSHILHLGDG